MSDVLKERALEQFDALVEFLRGAEAYEGVCFGDEPPDHLKTNPVTGYPQRYWWRSAILAPVAEMVRAALATESTEREPVAWLSAWRDPKEEDGTWYLDALPTEERAKADAKFDASQGFETEYFPVFRTPPDSKLREALEKALTWEERLNEADQLGRQGHAGIREALTIKSAILRERKAARRALEGTE